MDRKLNKRIAEYIGDFKKHIRKQAVDLDFVEKEKIENLISYVFDYERLVLTKEDVSKRKRIKNSIPCMNRCYAIRANGEQCTRKQKEGFLFCGTHEKGIPHGSIQDECANPAETDKSNDKIVSEVFAEEIGGIVYYLDKLDNVYCAEDILNNKENPQVVAKYECVEGVYKIPSFGI